MTIPDARIEAARRYGEAHGVGAVTERMVEFARKDVLGPPMPVEVVVAILLGEVTPVEEGAEDGG